jgi:hypothetical protein
MVVDDEDRLHDAPARDSPYPSARSLRAQRPARRYRSSLRTSPASRATRSEEAEDIRPESLAEPSQCREGDVHFLGFDALEEARRHPALMGSLFLAPPTLPRNRYTLAARRRCSSR